jgi:hypothetical protein
MTTPKPPTPQGISALLKKAGFERETLRPPTGVRWDGRPDSRTRKWLAGFQVHADRDRVVVRWRSGFVANPDSTAKDRATVVQLRCYANVITEAGWTVETTEYELIVTAGKAGH